MLRLVNNIEGKYREQRSLWQLITIGVSTIFALAFQGFTFRRSVYTLNLYTNFHSRSTSLDIERILFIRLLVK